MTTTAVLIVLPLLVLAVARFTRLITIDRLTEPLRMKLVGWWGQKSMWTYLFFCPWCMSVWVAALVGAVMWWATPVGEMLAGWGVSWWWGLPLFVLVASWGTGVLRGLED